MSQNKGIFEVGLAQNPANFQALTPLSFLAGLKRYMAPARRSSTEILSIPTLSSLRVAGDWPRP